jgi:hypothetical protein
MRDERRARTHARSNGGGLAAGVAAADHDDVECKVYGVCHRGPGKKWVATERKLAEAGCGVKIAIGSVSAPQPGAPARPYCFT